MKTRFRDENFVCLSVCLSVRFSVKRVDCDKTKKVSPDFYTIRMIIYPSFLRKRMVGWGDPFYLKFLVKLTALERNRRFSIYFCSSASAVTPSKKSSINTNRKSTTRFLMSPK